MLNLDQLVATVPPEEEVLAVGTASQWPVVVTSRRLLRAGHEAAVSIPFEAILSCVYWNDAHRRGIRLLHEPIDPQRPPGEASQWWRWHDRRKLRRLWRQTELTFSSDHTSAAEALWAQLADHGIERRESSSPVPRSPRARVLLRRVN